MTATLLTRRCCKMADRGQITGGLLDGPLAFDNAVSIAAARTKGDRLEVAGQVTSSPCLTWRAQHVNAKQLIFRAEQPALGSSLEPRCRSF